MELSDCKRYGVTFCASHLSGRGTRSSQNHGLYFSKAFPQHFQRRFEQIFDHCALLGHDQDVGWHPEDQFDARLKALSWVGSTSTRAAK
jgi:hypothetical protein